MERQLTNKAGTRRTAFSKCALSLGAAVSALGAMTAMPVAPAQAQQVDQITVTAQRREQDLQAVPIAVSAFTSEFLENAGVDDVLELQFFTPSLVVAPAQSPVQTAISVRGVGTAGNSLSLESSVGVYVDGVYRSRQASVLNDLVDVERVELLKGPQGTLFGRNTASGALQFITVAPQDEFGGWLEVNLGNLDFYNVKGAVNIPIVEGKLATRFSGSWAEREGFVENLVTGSQLNNRDRYQLRGQVLFTPTDDISFRLIADYAEIDELCCSAANVFDGPADTAAGFQAAVAEFGFPLPNFSPFVDQETSRAILGIDAPTILADQFDDDIVATDTDPFGLIEEWGISGELEWDLGWTTLTSITAYRKYSAESLTDSDFGSLPSLNNAITTEQENFSQEVRIAGTLFNERLNYVAGGYYFHQTLEDLNELNWGPAANLVLAGGLTVDQFFVANGILPNTATCQFVNPQVVPFCTQPVFPGGTSASNLSDQEQTSWALFGQVDYQLRDDLIITAGLRYNNETKDMNVAFREDDLFPGFVFFEPFSIFQPDVNNAEFEDSTFTYTAKLSYFVTDEILTYVSYGRGYKSGGTNIARIPLSNRDAVFGAYLAGINSFPLENFVVAPETITDTLFDPEVSKSWEIGMKGDFLSNRLRANVALFRTTFEDFQANTFVGTGFVLQNAGEIVSQGIEVDLQAAPTEWLFLSTSAAYLDVNYDSFEGGACIITPYGNEPDQNDPGFPATCDNSGNEVPQGSDWIVTNSARVTQPILDGRFTAYSQLDVRWTAETAGGNDNDPNKAADGFTLVNLRAGVTFGEEGAYDISLWAKNLFDTDWRGDGFNSVGRQGSITAYHTEPRTWGATLRARY